MFLLIDKLNREISIIAFSVENIADYPGLMTAHFGDDTHNENTNIMLLTSVWMEIVQIHQMHTKIKKYNPKIISIFNPRLHFKCESRDSRFVFVNMQAHFERLNTVN